MIHPELYRAVDRVPQNTLLWAKLREQCHICSSETGAALCVPRSGTKPSSRKNLYEVKVGLAKPPVYSDFAKRIMQHGHDNETVALEFMMQQARIQEQQPFLQHVFAAWSGHGLHKRCYKPLTILSRPGLQLAEVPGVAGSYYGASPDAILSSADGIRIPIEVKCPWGPMYSKVLPAHYCQLQTVMHILDVPLAMLVVYKVAPESSSNDDSDDDDDSPIMRIWLIRRSRDWYYTMFEPTLISLAKALRFNDIVVKSGGDPIPYNKSTFHLTSAQAKHLKDTVLHDMDKHIIKSNMSCYMDGGLM